MTEQHFSERELKEKLDNLESPYDPASWAKLEARLNAPFTEENPAAVEEIDKLVQPKLARLEPSFNEAHWKIMAARLRLIAVRRRQIISTKLLETALILLVLGNLPTWLGIQPPRDRQIFIPRNQAIAEWNEAGKNHGQSEISPKKQAGQTGFEDPVFFEKNKFTYSTDAEGNSLFNEKNAPAPPAISLPEEVFNVIHDFLLEKNAGEKPSVTPVPIAENGQPKGRDFLEPIQLFDEKNRNAVKLASLDELETRRVFVENPTAKAFVPLAYHFEKKNKRQLQVGIFAAPETNIVRTPSTEYGAPDYVQLVHGYAFGLTIGQKWGRLGYETGLIYQAKNLDRREISVYGNLQDGFVKQLLDRQEYEIVGIPVRMTAKIARAGHTTVSARGGFSANAIVQKNNVRKKIETPQPALPNTDGPMALYRKNKEEQSGLFEGGTLSENGFVTADAGLRFERPVGGRMSVFFEPMVQYSIKNQGIGLRKDRLSTFSWQVGMTATL